MRRPPDKFNVPIGQEFHNVASSIEPLGLVGGKRVWNEPFARQFGLVKIALRHAGTSKIEFARKADG